MGALDGTAMSQAVSDEAHAGAAVPGMEQHFGSSHSPAGHGPHPKPRAMSAADECGAVRRSSRRWSSPMRWSPRLKPGTSPRPAPNGSRAAARGTFAVEDAQPAANAARGRIDAEVHGAHDAVRHRLGGSVYKRRVAAERRDGRILPPGSRSSALRHSSAPRWVPANPLERFNRLERQSVRSRISAPAPVARYNAPFVARNDALMHTVFWSLRDNNNMVTCVIINNQFFWAS